MTTLRTPDSLATVWLSALRASGRSPATLTQYTETLNVYLPWLEREADTATRLDARRFQQHLLDTRSPGGAALYLRTIKSLYGWALREELIEANPFQGLSIRPPQDAQTTASREQIEFLIRAASSQSDRRQAARDRAIVTVPAFDQPLTTMQKGGIFALLALGKDLGHPVPNLPLDTEVKGAEAIAMLGDLFGHVFPNLAPM